MRKAIVSVTHNIAEGHGRWQYKENMRFCRIARGSTEEVLDDINVCLDEGYGQRENNEQLKGEGYHLICGASTIAKINSYIVIFAVVNKEANESSPDTSHQTP